ncbi:hypothetical protein HY439_03630 [Candidatus Microgenomates bacterium]|nr:hypothetical protein [Candidatus Microgenomates bacterium]
MNIEDFEIKIKKYDREKNCVIANVVVLGELELRGFVVRYTTTKYSTTYPVWIVSPPSVKGRNNNYFWVIKLKNDLLWQQLSKKLIEEANQYANSI